MYIDVLLGINLSMNYFLLLIVARIMRRYSSWYRLALGALIGVLPVLIMVAFNIFHPWLWGVLVVITPFFMIGLAFSPMKAKDYFFMGGLMFLAAFIICGFVNVLWSIRAVSPLGEEPILLVYLLMICFLLNGIVVYFQPYLEDNKWKGLLRVRVQVCLEDKTHVIEGYLDTGNRVKEPFSKRPVIIASCQSLHKVIPAPVTSLFKDNLDPVHVLESITDPNMMRRFYLIPFNGLGEEGGMLLGFYPDNIRIFKGEQLWDVGSQVAMGIYSNNFSKKEDFDALIPPEVLQMVS